MAVGFTHAIRVGRIHLDFLTLELRASFCGHVVEEIQKTNCNRIYSSKTFLTWIQIFGSSIIADRSFFR